VKRVPFGWRVGANKELIEDQKQQRAVTQMVKMREEGKSLAPASYPPAGHAASARRFTGQLRLAAPHQPAAQ
jgi:hypothetical protein